MRKDAGRVRQTIRYKVAAFRGTDELRFLRRRCIHARQTQIAHTHKKKNDTKKQQSKMISANSRTQRITGGATDVYSSCCVYFTITLF